jgi:hypothetical protein
MIMLHRLSYELVNVSKEYRHENESFFSEHLSIWKRAHYTHLIGGWVDPQSWSVCGDIKNPFSCREMNPCPFCNLVPILTELPRLL